MNGHRWIALGSVFGFLAVAMGAFGAHALAGRLSERGAAVYATGAQYQLAHALALLAFGLWSTQAPAQAGAAVGWCFTGGILLFSGSLYALAFTDIRALGAITPFGGVLFLIGWAILAWNAARASGALS